MLLLPARRKSLLQGEVSKRDGRGCSSSTTLAVHLRRFIDFLVTGDPPSIRQAIQRASGRSQAARGEPHQIIRQLPSRIMNNYSSFNLPNLESVRV
jgi:hypothetical protein